ncbi:MAG: NUDIX hydrolase [Candidatus Doudnabacteria bacterium Gr01-1014_77]|uniref:NUDIX hydrolase n=1 Tax=Candidatus Doudnabacteria bacterium Gr01-1014_77 TaxID=2017133 RepID=A0A554JD77_9BACT|nr:MAG: NUDIX hydrolase [Candidatus Doudnabacteria bacterium Gr01-1014_77]
MEETNTKTLQVGVKALLQNKEGKYLMLHRNLEVYPEVNNPWDIVGGRIDPGTSLLDNLKREILEETKLVLTDTPKLIAAQDILKNDKHVVRLTYTASIEGEPVLDTEHDSFKWLSLGEIKELDGLDHYVKEVLNNF